MDHVIILDTEFLTNDDFYKRIWMGPHDPDPFAMQIGAVRLALTGDFPIEASFS